MAKYSEAELARMRAVEPAMIDLKTQLLSGGMSKTLMCKGENTTFHMHCYSVGMGEKHGLHAHVQEEHLFVVLQGRAVFSSIGGKLPTVTRNQGIWLPKGCFYEFYNPGPDPLIVMRFGAINVGDNGSLRITPEGEPIPGRSSANPELAKPVIIEGQFFQ